MAEITAQNATEIISHLMLRDVFPIIVDLDQSRGNYLYDSRNNRRFLDCFSYVASNPVGHNHPLMSNPDFERKLLRAAKSKPSNSDFHTLEMAEFVDTFGRLALPSHLKYLFFVEGGAVGIENAMKAAFDWKVRLNFAKGQSDERGKQILHFKEAFHGRGGYTLSVTNSPDPRKTKYFPQFNWPRIQNPKIKFPLDGASLADVALRERAAVAEIEAAFQQCGDDIAAILIETIQAEGGDNHFRAEFHHELRRLADRYEALLIYDEVQAGGGITGKMWAYEHYGVEPDIVCFGKKMQVCGMMVGERIDRVENHVFKEASRINSTWGGGLVDMVRCQRYLEIVEEEKLLDNAAVVGLYLSEQLSQLEREFSGFYNNARGLGLMCAIDVRTVKERDDIVSALFDRGILILKCGVSTLRFRPSLTFSKAEVDLVIEALRACTVKVIS